MARIKLNNQKGNMLLILILSMGFTMFLFITINYLFAQTKMEQLEQSRFNNFVADKDNFYLSLSDILVRADAVSIQKGLKDLSPEGVYSGEKEYTTITASSMYTDGTNQYNEILQATDIGESVTVTSSIYVVDPSNSSKVDLKKTESQMYPSLNDLYVEDIKEVCYDDTTGNTTCQAISNLLDVVVYSHGVSGKSPEFNSRRLMYYVAR